MPFTLNTGQNKYVTINEPSRGMFPSNLGGAVEYTLTHAVYTILRVAGEGLGEFVAGFLIRFLERIEPNLVTMGLPLIDLLLKQPELPSELRQFLNNLKHPTHEAGAAVLTGFLGASSGAVANTILGSALMPVTYAINKAVRPSRPAPAEAYAMGWREKVGGSERNKWLQEVGYPDSAIAGFEEIARPRAGVETLLEGVRRGYLTANQVTMELVRRGFTPDDNNLFKKLVEQLLPEQHLIVAMYRGEKSQGDVVTALQKLGYTTGDAQTIVKIAENIPPLQDIIHMAVREAWRDDVSSKWGYDADFPGQVSEYVKKLGYNPDWAKRYWRAHWELPSVTFAIEMVHRDIISQEEFIDLLRIADFPAGWRDKMLKAVYTPFTRVDVRRMYKLGVLNYQEMVRAYKDIGYNDEKADKLAQFTEKYEAADPEDKPEKYKNLSQSLIQQAYQKGIISEGEMRARLTELLYPPLAYLPLDPTFRVRVRGRGGGGSWVSSGFRSECRVPP